MSKAEGEQPSLRELARDEPEAVRAVAERAGGQLGAWLERLLDEDLGNG